MLRGTGHLDTLVNVDFRPWFVLTIIALDESNAIRELLAIAVVVRLSILPADDIQLLQLAGLNESTATILHSISV